MVAPIFLYTGPEAGEKNDIIQSQKEKLKKKYGSSDDYLYYGTDINMSEVVAQLMTESLFTPATSVVIRSAEFIKTEKDIELLSQWVKSCEKKSDNDTTLLILVSDEMKVDSKLEKLVPQQNRRVFFEMFEDKKEAWLINFFKKNGYSIDADAVDSILEMIDNNTEDLRNECSRFFMCFPAGHTVTAAEVEQILAHNRDESVFTLFDAMIESAAPQKRFENCLSILQKIRLRKKDSDSIDIINGLVYCFRKLAVWQFINSSAKGMPPSETELKKNGFTSKTAKTQYTKASRIWSRGQVAAIEAILAKTDMEIRSMGSAFQDTQLILMIYEIVIKNGAYCSQYEPDY